jgi:hypothetical protein
VRTSERLRLAPAGRSAGLRQRRRKVDLTQARDMR